MIEINSSYLNGDELFGHVKGVRLVAKRHVYGQSHPPTGQL